MGGPGSGRRRTRPAVADCRALSIGELIDGGRWRSQREGEVLWRAPYAERPTARLAYRLAAIGDAGEQRRLRLAYRYRPSDGLLSYDDEVELVVARGCRPVALCPDCGRAVRSLYAPPGARLFLCRSCQALSYGRSAWRQRLADLRSAAGPALEELAALPEAPPTAAPRRFVAGPPPQLAEQLQQELPLGAQELRLWCLRLRAGGLSYRQIAPLVGSSKSSVARICAAGQAGIDRLALIRECVERAAAMPPLVLGTNRRALGAELRSLHAHLQRRRLSPPECEPEQREVSALESAPQLSRPLHAR